MLKLLNNLFMLDFEEMQSFEHSSPEAKDFFRNFQALIFGTLAIISIITLILSGKVTTIGFHFAILLVIPWTALIILSLQNIGPLEYGIVFFQGKPIFAVGPGLMFVIPWLFTFKKYSSEIAPIMGGVVETPTAHPDSAKDREGARKYASDPLNNPLPISMDYYFDGFIDGPTGLCTMVTKFGSPEAAVNNARIKASLILGEVIATRTIPQALYEKPGLDKEFSKMFEEIFSVTNKKSINYFGFAAKNLKTFKPIFDEAIRLKQKEVPLAYIDRERETTIATTARRLLIIQAQGEKKKSILESEAKKIWYDVESHGKEILARAEGIGKAAGYKAIAKACGISVIELELRLQIMGEALKGSNYSAIVGSEGFSTLLGFWPVLKNVVNQMGGATGEKGGVS